MQAKYIITTEFRVQHFFGNRNEKIQMKENWREMQ